VLRCQSAIYLLLATAIRWIDVGKNINGPTRLPQPLAQQRISQESSGVGAWASASSSLRRALWAARLVCSPASSASSLAWSAPPDAFLGKGSGRGTQQRIHSAFAGRLTRETLDNPSAAPVRARSSQLVQGAASTGDRLSRASLATLLRRSGRRHAAACAGQRRQGCLNVNLRAPRKITVGLPRLASEVSDGKGFHSGKRGEAGFFEVPLRPRK
jgi:hypothetical protein